MSEVREVRYVFYCSRHSIVFYCTHCPEPDLFGVVTPSGNPCYDISGFDDAFPKASAFSRYDVPDEDKLCVVDYFGEIEVGTTDGDGSQCIVDDRINFLGCNLPKGEVDDLLRNGLVAWLKLLLNAPQVEAEKQKSPLVKSARKL